MERQSNNHVKNSEKVGICTPRREAIRRNQTCPHLDPGLPASSMSVV